VREVVLVLTAILLSACNSGPVDLVDDIPPDVGSAMCTPAGAGPGWSFTRLGSGTKPALTVGAGGAAHVAFMNEATDGWVRYARLPLGASAPSGLETVASGYFYGPIDIVRGADGEPRVLYHDHDGLDQVVATRIGTPNWSLEPMPSAGHDGWYGSGVFDLAGTLHTATYDPAGFSGRGLVYGAWTGSSWTIETAAPGSFDYKGGTAIVWTPSELHVAFYDDLAGEPRLATRSAADTWSVTTPEPLGGYADVGRFPDMALDPDGQTLHLLYLATTGATAGVVRYALGMPGSFLVRDVASISGFSLGFDGARDIATMDLDLAARPVVAVQSLSELTLLRIDGAATEVLESFQAPAGVVFGQQTDIDVDDSDRIQPTWWQSGEVPGTVCHAVNGP
jgi:hypothetical protein